MLKRLALASLLLCVFLLAFGSVQAASAAPAASFGGPSYLGSGYYAYSHKLADLNNDGHPDLVVPMYNSGADGYLRTYLNNGSGGFTPSAVTTIPCSDAQMADLDRDGNVDAVCTTTWGNGHGLTIARGDGAGGLNVVGYIDLPYMLTYFRIADLNGDTIPDLIVGTGEFDNVKIYLGNGDCTFTMASVVTGIGYNSWSAAAGDINRDGKQDFVVANLGSATLDIRLGNGTGVGFTAFPDLPTGSQPTRPILADFNRDGILDLALIYRNRSVVSLWDGDGSGDFVHRRDITVTFNVNDLAAADVNCDGALDLVLGGQLSSGMQSEISVLLGDGSGNFPVQVKPGYGGSWAYGLDGISVADVNGDGRPDLVTSNLNSSWSNNIGILPNTSAIGHSLDLHVSSVSTGRANQSIAAGDFDRDGKTDLAVGGAGAAEMSILKGDGHGAMSSWTTAGISSDGGIAVGDLNRDGVPDLLSFNTALAESSLGDGSGGFAVMAMADATGCLAGVGVDGDRDGIVDAFSAADSGSTSVFFHSSGDGGLSAVNAAGLGNALRDVVTADLNGDAVPDVAGVSSAGSLRIGLGDLTGSFTSLSATLPGSPSGIAAGDINGDGKTDLMAACYTSGLQPMLNDGTGTMSAGTLTASAAVYDVALVDFDLDGSLDAVTSGIDGTVRYFDNNGSGVFTQVASVDPSGSGAQLERIAAADFDRDGRPDVAVSCNDGNVYVIRSADAAPYTTAVFSPYSPDGANGWYVTTPTVTFVTNEPATTAFSLNGSGWAAWDGSALTTMLPGGNTLSFWSVDAGLHQEATQTASFKVDTGKPVTTIDGLPGGASSSEVTFTLSATDTVSGVAHTYYTLNGGAAQTYAGAVSISAEGTTTVAWWSTDNAGNVEAACTADVVIHYPQPPATAPDSYVTDEDTPLTVAAAGVLGNDSDPEGGSMTATVGASPSHGSLSLASDGGFVYAPDADWNGTDTFTYTAVNAAGPSAVETVTITVNAVNDPPTAVALSNDTIAENEPAGSVVGTLTTTDVDSTSFTYSLPAGMGDNSAFAIDGDQLKTAESFDYETKSTYTVFVCSSDQLGAYAYQELTVNVKNALEPPVTAPDSYATDEDTTLTVLAPGVLGNDSDPLAGMLPKGMGILRIGPGMSASVAADPSHGTLTLASDGGFTYVPDADWYGTDTYTYVATNAEGSSSAETVTIDVAPVADAPTALSISNDTIAENEPTGSVVGTFTATDVDSTSFTYSLLATGDASAFTISGDELRAAQPFDCEAKPSYSIAVRVTDESDNTFDQDFTIHVSNVNEPPVAAEHAYETTEGVALSVPAPGLKADATDPDGDALDSIIGWTPAGHGMVNAGSDGAFTYTPDPGFHGTDAFRYFLWDIHDAESGPATVTITVHALDSQAPTTTSDAVASYSGEAVISLTATDGITGVKATYSKLDGAGAVSGTSVHVVTTGEHTLEFWSVDNADNVEATHTVTFAVTSDIIPIEGTDRYNTAVRTSQVAFPKGAGAAVICRGDEWADVAGGSALAGAVDGPLLLSRPGAIPPAVLAELDRLGVSDVYVLGDENAVSADVARALADALGGSEHVIRLGGRNRYATAALVAKTTADILKSHEEFSGQVFLATGEDFPDAIAAAPLADRLHRPIVLTAPGSLSAEASEALVAMGADGVHILGGVKSVSSDVATQVASVAGIGSVARLAGPDRYRTAIAVAEYGVSQGLEWNGLAVGVGTRFPDALSGGVMQGRFNSVVLLTYPDHLHPAVRDTLHAHRSEIGYVRILGDDAAVSEATRIEINDALK